MAKNEAWGIEVGAMAIKAIKLARSGNEAVVEDFEIIPFKHILTTPDVNVEEEIRLSLDSLAQKHEIDRSQVVVSVPGHKAFARFAKLPPVEPSKVQQIVAYEAQQQIPFPIEQVEWDYQVFAEDDAPDVEVGIFAITKERVAQFLSNYRAVDVRVDALTLSPVAVYNAFAYEHESDGGNDGTVYLDIGTTSTDIIIVEAGGIWLRTLPLGGNHFTEALMKQFKISFTKAEKLKKEASTSKYAKQIFQAMRGVFSDLVQEVQRSLGFYQSLNRDSDLEKIVGVGSTWKLPGLQKYLKQHLQMEVSRPDGFKRISVEGKRASEFSASAMNLATAYGLALQGLDLEKVTANILPQSILVSRMWKAKQPWFATAAACVAIGAGVAGIYHLFQSSSYASSAEDRPQIDRVLSSAGAIRDRLPALIAEDPRPEIDNYRRAFDYRDLWPKISEDIASALSTVPTQQELVVETSEGISAISRNRRRQVWITSIQTRFEPAPPAATTATVGGDGEAPAAPAEIKPLEAGIEVFFPNPETPGAPQPGPSIRVEITGITPLDRTQAEQLLNTTLIKWFVDNKLQADRPYRYRINPSTAVTKIFSRTTPPQISFGDTRSGRQGTPFGGGGAGFDQPRIDPEAGGGILRPGGQGGIGQPGRGRPEVQTEEITGPDGKTIPLTASGFAISDLFPKRPTHNELQRGDWRQDTEFTLVFDVVLLPPDEARRTMSPRTLEQAPPAQPATDQTDQTAQNDQETQR